ncbi:MAG: hypothetical protein AAFO89_10890 [Planctomycetota bacterium]
MAEPVAEQPLPQTDDEVIAMIEQELEQEEQLSLDEYDAIRQKRSGVVSRIFGVFAV